MKKKKIKPYPQWLWKLKFKLAPIFGGLYCEEEQDENEKMVMTVCRLTGW